MFLAVLQTLVLRQPYIKPVSKKYAFLVKRRRTAVEETPVSSSDDEPVEPQPKTSSQLRNCSKYIHFESSEASQLKSRSKDARMTYEKRKEQQI